MKIKEIPLSLIRGYTASKKQAIYNLICIVIILYTIIASFSVVYATVEKNNDMNTTSIGTICSQDDYKVQKMITDFTKDLQQNGYNITSIEPISKKQHIEIRAKEENISTFLDVIVSSVKLNIKNDEKTYYFKSKESCQDFITKLNNIKTQEYDITECNVSYSTITSTTVLDKKIAQVKAEKEKEDAAARAAQLARQKRNTTSRRSSIMRSYSFKGIPLSNYTYIGSSFGMRRGRMHTGVDIIAPCNTSIYAWKTGKVIHAGWYGGYGKFIIIDHGDGMITRYGHCNSIAVSVGQTVSQGQVIGYVGSTGRSTGYHLHFEVLIGGKFVNPMNYLSI